MREQDQDNLVNQSLTQLRGAMAGLEASEGTERIALAAFRERKKRRVPVFAWLGVAAAGVLAASLAIVFANQTVPDPEAPRPQLARIEPPPSAWLRSPEPPRVAVVASSRPKPKLRQAPVPARVEEVVATDFLPLPFAPPIAPNDGGHVIRVNLPRSAMRAVGLPVNENRFGDRVPADVFFGEDGFARAVRFVRVAR